MHFVNAQKYLCKSEVEKEEVKHIQALVILYTVAFIKDCMHKFVHPFWYTFFFRTFKIILHEWTTWVLFWSVMISNEKNITQALYKFKFLNSNGAIIFFKGVHYP